MPRKTAAARERETPMVSDQRTAETLVPPTDAARLLGTTVAHLEAGRLRNTLDLPFYKLGKLVRYKLSDLEAFRERHRVTPGGGK
jgi:hypothetical protein